MKTDTSICPICKNTAKGESEDPLELNFTFDCNRCGSFRITEEALGLIKSDREIAIEELFKISAYLRERSIANDQRVTIVTSRQNIGKIQGSVVGVDDILAVFPKTISERLDRALKNLQRLSTHPGATIELFGEKDYPVFYSENAAAFYFFRNTLVNAGLIKSDNKVDNKNKVELSLVTLTLNGWNRIAELEREKAGKDSRQAFVAMWFDSSLDTAWRDGFEKAIKDAGYEPLRIDLKEHNEKICDAIIAEIRKSCFLVADFTGFRSGVFFEAGYALGLGIPVIWTCREGHKDELDRHFDTRQYPHIFWTDESDLYEKLRRRIEATIAAD